MITRLFWMLGALLVLFAGAPTVASRAVAMECRAGRYAESGSSPAGGGAACARRGTAWGLAIDVATSPSAYTDDPACPQGDNTDQLSRDLARAAGADRTDAWVGGFNDFWNRFLRRTSSFGGALSGLAQGGFSGKSGSRCQVFVVPVPVPADRITGIDFQAGQGGKPASSCFRTEVRKTGDPKAPYAMARPGGSCEIGASGWRSGVVLDDKGGAVVAAVFKNWSPKLGRTGVLWVWF